MEQIKEVCERCGKENPKEIASLTIYGDALYGVHMSDYLYCSRCFDVLMRKLDKEREKKEKKEQKKLEKAKEKMAKKEQKRLDKLAKKG